MDIVSNIYKQQLTDKEFSFLSQLIYNTCGINLQIEKKILVESRLRKRVLQLQMSSFKEYVEYLRDDSVLETEIVPMIDLVSTNKTDFFREPEHFNFMDSKILPEYLESEQMKYFEPFKVWCSASSTGEEPYTISIVINEFMEKTKPFKTQIFASDINTQVLSKASQAVYEYEKIETISPFLKKKYFLKSKNSSSNLVRVVKPIREMVKFLRINLMDNASPIPNELDIVFCRNVLIYFDKETQIKVVKNLLSHLRIGGYLIMGHSETLQSMDLPVKRIESTIYRKIS
jgi:chemotaxis protein methyltransferase CheR